MPLPFIAGPLIYGAAAGSTVSTSIATLIGVGAGTGGAVVGAGSLWLWGIFSKQNTQPSQAHQDSIAAQNRITEDRINGANETLESLSAEAAALRQEVREAASTTTVSIEQLNQFSVRISETNERLMMAMESAREAGSDLAESLPALREISTRSHFKGTAAITMLSELNELLTLKVNSLTQTTRDIRALNTIIDDQTAVIARLGSTVETLSSENETQRKVIVQKDRDIAQLKAVSDRLSEHCRFYKQQLSAQPTTLTHVPTAVLST